MQLQDLNAFVAVATDRSFSKAAKRLHRTQPAISQAIRRLEDELGERLFDRSSRNGALTEAGVLLREHAAAAAAAGVARRRPRSASCSRCGAAAWSWGPTRRRCTRCCRSSSGSRGCIPQARVEVRRVASRQIATELLEHSLDFGVLTFQPPDKGLQSISLGSDELVLLANPKHRLAPKKRVTHRGGRRARSSSRTTIRRRRATACCALYERRHAPINIQIALPSLDGIKRAVEMGLGVAVLPRRCALTEIARGHLVAVKVPELSAPRSVRFVFRKSGELSRAAAAFLEAGPSGNGGDGGNGQNTSRVAARRTEKRRRSKSRRLENRCSEPPCYCP